MYKQTKILSQASQDLIDNLEKALDRYNSALRYNLKAFVRHMVFKSCLLAEQDGSNYGPDKSYMVEDLDKIIDAIIETSEDTSRGDGENYPRWDKKTVDAEYKRVMKVLFDAGVALQKE